MPDILCWLSVKTSALFKRYQEKIIHKATQQVVKIWEQMVSEKYYNCAIYDVHSVPKL